MSLIEEQTPGSLVYLERRDEYVTEKPYFFRFPVDDYAEAKQHNLEFKHYEVQIHDIRGYESDFEIDEAGFQITQFTTKFQYQDFNNFDRIKDAYFSEVKSFFHHQFGATWVNVFDVVIRRRTPGFPKEQFQMDSIQPIHVVHIDSSRGVRTAKATKMLREAGLGEGGGGRVRMLGLWRPLRGPVRDWPLAVCDSRTQPISDIVDVDQIYPYSVGEGCNVYYNPEHKWYFASNMEADEVWMMKMLDSDTNASEYCAHAAFPFQDVGPDEMRESIEIRALIWTPDPEARP